MLSAAKHLTNWMSKPVGEIPRCAQDDKVVVELTINSVILRERSEPKDILAVRSINQQHPTGLYQPCPTLA